MLSRKTWILSWIDADQMCGARHHSKPAPKRGYVGHYDIWGPKVPQFE